MAVGQTEGARTGDTSDIHFTVLAFTAGTGEAIMCAVILKSEKEKEDLPLSWSVGIDVSKDVVTGETLVETYDNNCETGASIGGPVCRFMGKILPCFVCTSPNASITSELLVEMVTVIDESGVFPRTELDGMPFLLIDGHHSRTRLPFLQYINHPIHPWKVCIGVPYATHMWQPHDSSELNGTFKVQLYKTKEKYLRAKPQSKKRFVSTDIIPILNKTWPTTLGNPTFAKTALIERGWFALNYVLMDDPRLLDDSTTTGNQVSDNINLSTLNTTGEVFTNTLDLLVTHRLKSEGRKRKFDALKAEGESKEGNVNHVDKMLSVTSGQLACRSKYLLDESVRDRMIAIDSEKKRKLDEATERRVLRISKDQNSFRNAAVKYFKNKEILTALEMRALIKEVSTRLKDSPMKSTIAGLKDQLYRRRARLEKYDLFRDDVGSNGRNENENVNFHNNESNKNRILQCMGDVSEVGELFAGSHSSPASTHSAIQPLVWPSEPVLNQSHASVGL